MARDVEPAGQVGREAFREGRRLGLELPVDLRRHRLLVVEDRRGQRIAGGEREGAAVGTDHQAGEAVLLGQPREGPNQPVVQRLVIEHAQAIGLDRALRRALVEQQLSRVVAEAQQLGVGLAEVEDRECLLHAHDLSPPRGTLAMMTLMPASRSMRSSASEMPSSVMSVAMRAKLTTA